MESCFYAYFLPLLGPTIAWIYALSVHGFLAGFGEADWCSNTSALLLRTALVGASVAVGVGLCESGKGDMWEAIVPVAVVLTAVSMYFSIQTRRNEIVGPVPVVPDNGMEGKVVLVTGANTGIGKQTVQQLAALGATVILGCRNETKAKVAMEDITQALQKENNITLRENQLRFLQIDLASLDSIRTAAKTFLDDFDLPLHVLINNAGVMFSNKTVTNDEFEMCFQANHLGHFLLTNLLLPKLLENKDARVLNLSSITYKMANKGFNFDDVNCNERPYTLFGQYAQSKVANVLFTKELATRFDGKLTAYAVNPGIVRTDVTRNMSFLLKYGDKLFGFLVSLYQKTPSQGAYTSVFGATTAAGVSQTDMPPNGSFLSNSHMEVTNDYINDQGAEDAKRLWELSEKLVGLKPSKK